MSSIPTLIVYLFLLAALVALAYSGLRRVPQGFEYLIERRGRYHRTLTAGTHVVVPLLERVGAMQDIRENQLPIKTLTLVTRDEISVEVALSCFIQIVDAAKAGYEVRNVRGALEELISTQAANVLAACPLGQLVSDRERVLRELPERLDRATEAWGVKVTRLEVKDVRPPDALLQAILEERRAEHTQRAALIEAETQMAAIIERNERERVTELSAEEKAMTLVARQAELAEQQAQLAHEAVLQNQARELAAAFALRTHEHELATAAAQTTRATQGAERQRLQMEAQAQRLAAEQQLLAQQQHASMLWQEEMNAAERARELDRQRHLAEQAQAEHEARLAIIAAERDRDEQIAGDAADAARSEQRHAAALAETARERELAVARMRLAQEEHEHELLAATRGAEVGHAQAKIAHDEAVLRARAKEVVAEADARAIERLSAALGAAPPHTMVYLAAREHADALRSLGHATGSAADNSGNPAAGNRVIVIPGNPPPSDAQTQLDALMRMASEPVERG